MNVTDCNKNYFNARNAHLYCCGIFAEAIVNAEVGLQIMYWRLQMLFIHPDLSKTFKKNTPRK